MKKILFFQHVAQIGGAAWSLVQIVQQIRGQYEIQVVLCEDGPVRGALEALQVNVIVDSRIIPFCGAFAGVRLLLFNTAHRRGLLGYKQSARVARMIGERERPDLVYL